MKQFLLVFSIVLAICIWIPDQFVCQLMGQDSLTQQTQSQESWWPAKVHARLQLSGDNKSEILKALNLVPQEHRKALVFLIEHMPESDLNQLSGDYLVRNISLAYQAINESPWGKKIPEEIFFNDILPYANIDETREDWRSEMRERCLPIVKDCKTPSEAAQKLNRELFGLVNVRYSTSRKKANQSPSESMEQSVASCTGLSILLSDACRSVGVPARLAGIPSWANKPGNHTWVEIWDQQWHFTGAAEPASEGLNHGWFKGDAALAKNEVPKHRIYAASFAETGMHFPMVWAPRNQSVPAVNVTQRYVAEIKPLPANVSRVLIRIRDQQGKRIKCSVRILAKSGATLAGEGQSRDESFDTNDVLTFELPRNAEYTIELSSLPMDQKPIVMIKKTDGNEQVLWDFEVK